MIGAPRTVLLVDDDAAARWLYDRALPPLLPEFQLVTAPNGAEALAILAERPIEVLVTDLHMPVMDGFRLLATVRERHPNLGVVVLSSMHPDQVSRAAPQLATYRRVPKPAPAAQLADHVRAAAAERVRGHIAEAPLAPLLGLLALERSTCALLVRSGARKGRLHFRDGELVNAYAFELDRDGEPAARHLLAWDRASVDFERSLHNHVRTIHTPLQRLILDVARERDETDRSATPSAHAAAPGPTVDAPRRPALAPPRDGASPLEVALAGLHVALDGLRSRAAELPAVLAPARSAAHEAQDRPLRALAAPAADALDVRVAALARALAERAHALGAGVADEAATPPTWIAVRPPATGR